MKIGVVTPTIMRVTTLSLWTTRQKWAYQTEYFRKCSAIPHQIFSVGRRMCNDDYIDIRFVFTIGTFAMATS